MIEIIPAVMPKTLEDLQLKLAFVADHVDMVQLDVMDGKFVRAYSWPYAEDYGSFKIFINEEEGLPFWEKIDYEIDLMVLHPEMVIDDWIAAGASRLIVHVESTEKIQKIIDHLNSRFAFPMDYAGNKIKGEKREVEFGLALNVDTPTSIVLPYLEDIDFVQFMGIETIGRQGEPFADRVIDKIRQFHNAHPEVIISIDGGVSLSNAHALVGAGARRLVSGSAIFESSNIAAMLAEFKNLG